MSSKFYYFVLILFGLANSIDSYRFDCLRFNESSCQCDTEEELIDCNSLGLIRFPQLKTRLRGYTVWTLAFNDISGPIPHERQLLKYLPDLQLIDLRKNEKLNCHEIAIKFDRVNVQSECTERERPQHPTSPGSPIFGQTAPNPQAPCTTFWCRLERSASSAWLKTFAHVNHVWQLVKGKWERVKEKLCQKENNRDKQGLFEITR